MFTKDFLHHDATELELEIEHRCLALQLDCRDEAGLRLFVHDILSHLGKLKTAAAKGDITARTKMELYGLTMLLHQNNLETLGPDYLQHFAELARGEVAWAALVRAMWHELQARAPLEKGTKK